MPAPLPFPTVVRDTRIWRDDAEFLDHYLAARNMTLTELMRELTHRYANAKRKQLGLAVKAPYPPGELP